ncbi:MAG: BolA family protein [Rickettsiales bacterium]
MNDLERYRRALCDALDAEHVTLSDDSAGHMGHGGWKEGAATHISVEVVSPKFAGLSRLARQKMIYSALKPFMDADLHAVCVVRADAPAAEHI